MISDQSLLLITTVLNNRWHDMNKGGAFEHFLKYHKCHKNKGLGGMRRLTTTAKRHDQLS